MRMWHGRNLRAGLASLALIGFSLTAYAGEPAPADQWTFTVRPYLWLPSITGTLKYDMPSDGSGGGANVDLSSYVLENLNFALMVSADARKGDWAVLTDVVYLDVESDDSRVKSVDFAGPGGRIEVPAGANLDTKATLSGVLWGLAGAWTAVRGGNSSLDVLAGFRMLNIKAESDYLLSADIVAPDGSGRTFGRSGGVSKTETLWDGIVGVRGSIGLGESKWDIPYYLDVGTGGSAVTYQGVAGIGYRFHWGDLQLMYRYLYYDMKEDKLLQGVSFYGPALGLNFRF